MKGRKEVGGFEAIEARRRWRRGGGRARTRFAMTVKSRARINAEGTLDEVIEQQATPLYMYLVHTKYGHKKWGYPC